MRRQFGPALILNSFERIVVKVDHRHLSQVVNAHTFRDNEWQDKFGDGKSTTLQRSDGDA